jgi:hypothetical protein
MTDTRKSRKNTKTVPTGYRLSKSSLSDFPLGERKYLPFLCDPKLFNLTLKNLPLHLEAQFRNNGFVCIRKPGKSRFSLFFSSGAWSTAESLASENQQRTKQCTDTALQVALSGHDQELYLHAGVPWGIGAAVLSEAISPKKNALAQ